MFASVESVVALPWAVDVVMTGHDAAAVTQPPFEYGEHGRIADSY